MGKEARSAFKLGYFSMLYFFAQVNFPDFSRLFEEIMPKKRFELLQGCPYNALNVARLPIPPLRLYFAQMFSRLSFVEAALKRDECFFEAKGESTLAKKNQFRHFGPVVMRHFTLGSWL